MDPDLVYECPEYDQFLSDDEISHGHRVHFRRTECIRNYLRGKCEGSCQQEFLSNSEYYVLRGIADKFGFSEYTIEVTQNDNGEIISTRKSVQGFYVIDNKAVAAINEVANPDLIPKSVVTGIQLLYEVDNLYEGYEYLLVKARGRISTFNVSYYRNILELMREVDFYVSSKVNKVLINDEGTILVIDTGQTKYLIAAIADEELVEVERSLITAKLDSARPFFTFKSVMKVDWSRLKPNKGDNFEKLVEALLRCEHGVIEVASVGKTTAADRGRDFLVTEKVSNTFGEIVEKKWMVQCKYSDKSLSTKSVRDWVTRTVEHSVDGYWLITNSDMTPDLIDQLLAVPKNEKYKIDTRFWQRNTFDIKLATRPEIFSSELFFDKPERDRNSTFTW